MNSQPLVEVLMSHSSIFHNVVPFDPLKDKVALFDFSKNNKEIFEDIFSNTQKFTNYINQKLQSAQAKFGIGGYNEYRDTGAAGSLTPTLMTSPGDCILVLIFGGNHIRRSCRHWMESSIVLHSITILAITEPPSFFLTTWIEIHFTPYTVILV